MKANDRVKNSKFKETAEKSRRSQSSRINAHGRTIKEQIS